MLESILLSKHQPKDSRAVFHPLTVAKLTDPHETERNLPLFCHRMLSTSSASAPDWAQAKGMMEVSITLIARRLREGYGKLLKVDFHDSACDSHFVANEEVDGPVRLDRYLDSTLQI